MGRILGRHWRSKSSEPVPAPLRLAFVAGTIDVLLLFAAIEAARRASGAPSLWTDDVAGDASPWTRTESAVSVLVAAAAVVCDVMADGRTLGRAAAGIRLERDSGRPLDLRTRAAAGIRRGRETARPLDLGTAVIRELAAPVVVSRLQRPMLRALRGNVVLTWTFGLAVLVARIAARAADPHKRSLEDRIAGTRLVRSRPWWRR